MILKWCCIRTSLAPARTTIPCLASDDRTLPANGTQHARLVGFHIIHHLAGHGFQFIQELCCGIFTTLYFSQGSSKTAHYAFCTGFMALSLMLPGMFAGWLADMMGYYRFFILIMCLTPLTFLAASIIRVPADFGMKKTHLSIDK